MGFFGVEKMIKETNLFYEELKLKKEIDVLSKKELVKRFKSLDYNNQIDILIRWFGSNPLTEKLISKSEGIDYLKEKLWKLSLKESEK